TATSTNPPADQLKTLTVETPIPTVSSLVPTACFTDSQDPSSDTRLISKRVANQVETPSLDNILTLTNRLEDILRFTINSDESNGVEADINNIEITITASPTPTLRIHKDHPKSQIIGPVDTPIQTRNKSKEMDVKSAFLYGTIDEEVYVMQPSRFQDLEFPAKVYKVEKAISKIGDFILVQVYMDDIIFGSSNPQLCKEFEALMQENFQMSAMGELNFFLGLPDIMFAICAWARHQVIHIECHMHAVKRIFRYLKGHPKLGLWYPKESPFNLVAYSDSDYGGATQYHKSTTGGCQFLGRRLISWQCKKQTIVATSITVLFV
nr:putative ribonuclease H-like domain-containing protein [Tanacetum cinerariifolium]